MSMGTALPLLGLGLGVVLGVSVAAWPQPAGADAVPPAPESCPAGYIPVTSHAGPQCVLKPPASCPPGWRGILGGLCAVHVCQTDANCTGRDDLRCKPAKVCIHEYLQEWGWGASLPATRDDRSLFAEPPRHFSPPRKVQKPVDVCADDPACPAESTCQQSKVCLPAGVDRPGRYQPPKLQPPPVHTDPRRRRPPPMPPT
jgi:hypothetical protein